MAHEDWPALPLSEWQGTYETLHRWTQIVGKTCLALAPFQNHWWHCALHLTTHGLRTPTLFCGQRSIEIEFDFRNDVLNVVDSDGRGGSVGLYPRSVADFYAEYMTLVATLEFEHHIRAVPAEMADTLPFPEDNQHRAFDADAARRCWQILQQSDRLLKQFRSRFYGKCSPSHFWWGGFDLACTRFSGRRAPVHPGGIPNLPDWVTREAYSDECISAGWWPGSPGAPMKEPAYYAYAYPEPAGCPDARVEPDDAYYHTTLHEWILPYEAVRSSSDPDAAVLAFVSSTYRVASNLGGWSPELERPAPHP